jgi:hypothetical protein
MPSTRSRRYDDPVEDQPAEDPLINQPQVDPEASVPSPSIPTPNIPQPGEQPRPRRGILRSSSACSDSSVSSPATSRNVQFDEASNELFPILPNLAVTVSPPVCASCHKDIGYEGFFDVKPCHHIYCCSCFASALARKIGHESLSCAAQGCGGCIGSHRHYAWKGTIDRHLVHDPADDDVMHNRTPPITHQQDIRQQPDPSKDPLRSFFKETGKAERDGKGFIYIAVGEGAEGQVKIRKAKFDSLGGFEQDEQAALFDIFKLLHPLLFPRREQNQGEQADMNPRQLVYYALNEDKHIAIPCLYALGTGAIYNEELRMEFSAGTSYKRSAYLGCFVAKEMLLRVGQENPSVFQLCIADMVFTLTRCRLLLDILSEFRVGAHFSTMIRHARKRDDATLSKQMVLPYRSFTVFVMDNLNFTLKGAKVSNDQWTTLSIYVITEEQLKAAGFYQDDDPEKRISRVRKTRQQFLDDQNCQNIASITNDDYKALSFYTLQHLKTIMELQLPTFIECYELKELDDYATTYEIPRNLGVDITPRKNRVDDNGKRVVHKPLPYPSVSDDFIDITNEVEPTSIIDQNNIFVDIPVHDDLAKTTVVQDFLDYACRDAARRIEVDNRVRPEGHERPVQEVMTALSGDGSPCVQTHRLKDLDARNPEEEQLYKSLHFFAGAFHMKMEQIKKKAELLFEALFHIVKQYRKTQGKQDWVMNPRDPNQMEDEVISCFAAMLRAAIDSIAETLHVNTLSPAAVNAHMLKRAQEYPIAMLMLMEYRFTEVYYIIRDAEKSDSIDLYFTAIRLLMPLFAVTNAYNYVRLCSEVLYFWDTASDAEKVLYEHFVYTGKSADGHPMALDLIQEKINLLYRNDLGHMVRPGHVNRMYDLTLSLQSVIDKKQSVREMKGQAPRRTRGWFNERKVKVNEVYVSTYLAIRQMNVWGEGPIKVGNAFDEAEKDHLNAPSGKRLNAEVLKAHTIGRDRVREGWILHYVQTRNVVDRGGKATQGFSYERIQSKAVDSLNSLEKKIILGTSTEVEALEKAAKNLKLPLIEEIFKLRAIYPEAPEAVECGDLDEDEMRKKHKVSTLSSLLVRYRMNYYDAQPEARERNGDTIRARGEVNSRSTEEERIEEMDSKLFQCDPVILANFQVPIQIAERNDDLD